MQLISNLIRGKRGRTNCVGCLPTFLLLQRVLLIDTFWKISHASRYTRRLIPSKDQLISNITWRCGVVVITTTQLHSIKSELKFCGVSNPARRRGHHEVFCKDVIKNFAKFTGKHLCQSLFFNKVAGLTEVSDLQISDQSLFL